MSDSAKRARATSGKTRQRRKGAQRGGRHGLTRPAIAIQDGEALTFGGGLEAGPPLGARRTAGIAAPRLTGMSREAEFAYIRSDMRRLLIIAGGLMALMLVILMVVGR